MSRPRLLALLLALTTLVIYLPAVRHAFVTYDDGDYVTENRMVQNGLTFAGLQWAFTTGHAQNWHPLTWLSHMADCQFFGMNAGAHHAISVLFHAANTALLFLFLLRLTQKIWPAALVAALFAWHPLHVESVAWIAERKDVLSTFFALLTLLSYTDYARNKSGGKLWLAVLFFALGLMSKPMLVTLPFVLLLLDYWPLQRFCSVRDWRPLLVEKIPFFLLTLAACIVTLLVQRATEASLHEYPLWFRCENSAVATAKYLLKMAWPDNLAVFYPLTTVSAAAVVGSILTLAAISVAAWIWRKDRPYFIIGWLWFLGTLVPVIGLVQVGSAAMADRYAYIPSVGIFIIIAFGLEELAGKIPRIRSWLPAGAAVVLIACVVVTERQLAYWQDTETLFKHALAVTKDNYLAYDNLGLALERQSRPTEALAAYRESLRLDPSHRSLQLCIGNMLEKMGQPGPALAEYQLCLAQDPQIAALHGAAAGALATLGKQDEARAEIFQAEQLDPKYALPHIVAGKIFLTQNQTSNAVAELWAAVRAEPYNPEVLTTVARCLAADPDAAVRDGRNAVVFAMKANELAYEHNAAVFDVLGMAFAETGDFTNAVASAENAIELGTEAKMADVPAFQNRLELYRKQQPWREAFAATNAPAQN
ncbi:MAG TPA: tetratricopeptide repeat protein [Verrucomicrobiae bacterium]|nr:tetratricopeptide repeat protein [Verrucomicrobiae bacterium]